jgi:hypothetical protein
MAYSHYICYGGYARGTTQIQLSQSAVTTRLSQDQPTVPCYIATHSIVKQPKRKKYRVYDVRVAFCRRRKQCALTPRSIITRHVSPVAGFGVNTCLSKRARYMSVSRSLLAQGTLLWANRQQTRVSILVCRRKYPNLHF